MADNLGTVPLENPTDPLPTKSSKKGVLFFLLLGIVVAFVFFPERTKNLLNQVDVVEKITNIPQPTPVVLAAKNYLITNETDNISVSAQDSINIELKLNKNALNKLDISNLNVLKVEKPLVFDSAKDVFVGTVKAISTGDTNVTITENNTSQIFNIKITVTEKSLQ